MATTLNGTMGSAKSAIDAAMNGASHAAGTAQHALENAKDGTEHAVASARSTVMDGIHAFTSAVTMIRNLGVADALGWIGLERRRSPLAAMGIFSAGFAAGAGAGLLFAPMSGAAMRRKLAKGFMGVEAEVEAEVKAMEHKAEALAGKAKDAVMKAEHAVEHAVEGGADAVKHGVESAAGAVKEGVKHATDDAKAAMSSNQPARASTNGADAARADKARDATSAKHT
jgi:gas vesicle protein